MQAILRSFMMVIPFWWLHWRSPTSRRLDLVAAEGTRVSRRPLALCNGLRGSRRFPDGARADLFFKERARFERQSLSYGSSARR
jgi:hypothetical protein